MMSTEGKQTDNDEQQTDKRGGLGGGGADKRDGAGGGGADKREHKADYDEHRRTQQDQQSSIRFCLLLLSFPSSFIHPPIPAVVLQRGPIDGDGQDFRKGRRILLCGEGLHMWAFYGYFGKSLTISRKRPYPEKNVGDLVSSLEN